MKWDLYRFLDGLVSSGKLNELAGPEFRVLLVLCNHARLRRERDGVCWPRVSIIGQQAGMGGRWTRRVLRRLEAVGVITSTPGVGRRNPSVYQLVILDREKRGSSRPCFISGKGGPVDPPLGKKGGPTDPLLGDKRGSIRDLKGGLLDPPELRKELTTGGNAGGVSRDVTIRSSSESQPIESGPPAIPPESALESDQKNPEQQRWVDHFVDDLTTAFKLDDQQADAQQRAFGRIGWRLVAQYWKRNRRPTGPAQQLIQLAAQKQMEFATGSKGAPSNPIRVFQAAATRLLKGA